MKKNSLILLAIALLLASCNLVDGQKNKIERITEGEGEELLQEIYGTNTGYDDIDLSSATAVRPRDIIALLPPTVDLNGLTFYLHGEPGEDIMDKNKDNSFQTVVDYTTSTSADVWENAVSFQIDDGAINNGYLKQIFWIIENDIKDGSVRIVNKNGHQFIQTTEESTTTLAYVKQNRYIVQLRTNETYGDVTAEQLYDFANIIDKIDFPQ